jgi:hypothetical protein
MEHSRIIVEAEQRSPEWHAARLGLFTSSEIYRLMTKPKLKGEVLSEGAKTYILEKVAESLTGIREDVFTTQAMQWGIDNEPLAKKHLARLNNWTIEETSFIKIESLNWGTSGDGWVREINGSLEVKCLETKNHLTEVSLLNNENIKQDLPKRYWQILSDAFIRECDKGVLTYFDPRINNNWGLVKYVFKIPKDDIEYMKEKVTLANEEFKHQLNIFS